MVAPKEIRWELLPAAQTVTAPLRAKMTPEEFDEDRDGLRDLLCGYFNSDTGKDCRQRSGNAVCPMGGVTKNGGKCLKVRWGIPGYGKSGGLRFAAVAYCDEKRVRFVRAWIRKDDPQDEDFEAAFKTAP